MEIVKPQNAKKMNASFIKKPEIPAIAEKTAVTTSPINKEIMDEEKCDSSNLMNLVVRYPQPNMPRKENKPLIDNKAFTYIALKIPEDIYWYGEIATIKESMSGLNFEKYSFKTRKEIISKLNHANKERAGF